MLSKCRNESLSFLQYVYSAGYEDDRNGKKMSLIN